MCGIAGVYNFDSKEIDKSALVRMSGAIKHRGPDGEGFYINLNFGMAHRRLSIIDLEKGSQPIYNEDKSVVIVYNGEIYNHKIIKDELKLRGHNFRTETDSEVVLHAYEEWGVDSLLRFNGMFAYAIWEEKDRRLIIARDRLGIKPLYYYLDDQTLVFSSEIKSILRDSRVVAKVDCKALIDYTTFQNILDGKTFFNAITKLLPAHYLMCDKDGARVIKYWEISIKKNMDISMGETLALYEKLLVSSVKSHLMSDVPVGSYLSGGFDSASVAYFASKDVGYRLNTFTGYFNEGDRYDERRYAREVVHQINAIQHEVMITPKDFIEWIEKVVYHLDEPTIGTGALPHFLVSQRASRHVKVVLTGHGGDELFAGYPVYKAAYLRELFKEDILGFIKNIKGIKRDEIPRILYYALFPFIVPEVKHGLFIMFDRRNREKLFSAQFLKQYKGYNPLQTAEKISDIKNLTDSDKVLLQYLKTYLPALFIQEDKVGMANSIEARVPFCDNELIDFALMIPIRNKLNNSTLKYLTKEIMRNKLPSVIYKNSKKGFPTPLARWFRNELREYVYDILTSKIAQERGIFNIKYIRNMLDAHCSRKTDTLWDYASANRIYSLLTVELWFRIFIDKRIYEKDTSC